uniref:Uncharacterized protein n=1 Tax=Gopherus agassizii TaxID=38772 RepID=A0A452HV42_9SAUR
MPGSSVISFNCVDSSLSSLKNCQSYINTGMDIATNVALDLVENCNDVEEVNSMESVMLEYAAMDRELNHYMQAVEATVQQIKRDKPENIPDLKDLVKKKFTALESKNDDSDLQRNEKYIHFMEQLKRMRKQWLWRGAGICISSRGGELSCESLVEGHFTYMWKPLRKHGPSALTSFRLVLDSCSR